ncbi:MULTISPECIES: DUF4376 domain-containing protein [unclassified Pyramidobacter]|uniref:DUF4376 domain-containing protein n=1 Tax=unclassified Pyramidobacter TaxID=2632171 RepID=UPI000EA0AE83|nr:DUF4376 domain-containing protein [Pyramidobacter sp. CG50-2]RKJ80521.1 DUF4376 domain-containing protein [Pyramidobacter sp. CG50-2]
MIVYDYKPETGEYVASIEAPESPLEPGVCLLPAHSTTDEPPAAGPGYVAVYRDGAWSLVEDHRGEVRYDTATRERHEIKELGPVPAEWTAVPPEDGEAVWDGTKWSVPFDVLKERKKREITAARNAAIAAGTTWRTHAVDADEDAQRAVSAQIVKSMAYQQMGRPVPDTPWRLRDGSYVTLSDADVWDLSQTIEAHVSGCYAREAALAAQIEAAETPEDLNAICWE